MSKYKFLFMKVGDVFEFKNSECKQVARTAKLFFRRMGWVLKIEKNKETTKIYRLDGELKPILGRKLSLGSIPDLDGEWSKVCEVKNDLKEIWGVFIKQPIPEHMFVNFKASAVVPVRGKANYWFSFHRVSMDPIKSHELLRMSIQRPELYKNILDLSLKAMKNMKYLDESAGDLK